LSPHSLKELHGSSASRRWSGHAQVRHGGGILARTVRAIVGFPKAASDVPVTVTFSPEDGGERWVRRFGGKAFSSLQSVGAGRNEHLLVERFGVASFALALVIDGGRLCLVPRRWSLLGIPMPAFLLPRGVSFEYEDAGRFHFDVEISAPVVGLIVAYKGSLEPSQSGDPSAGIANGCVSTRSCNAAWRIVITSNKPSAPRAGKASSMSRSTAARCSAGVAGSLQILAFARKAPTVPLRMTVPSGN